MWEAIYLAWTRFDFARRIRKHGWTGTYISAPDDEDHVPFSYSIGFWESAGSPEIIMFGADAQTANELLHEAYKQLKAGDLVLADLAPWNLDWEGGPSFKWRKVHASQIRREHFNAAIWYRERQGQDRYTLEAYQLFVSDRNHVFPWEDGWDVTYRPLQKELYLPFFGPPDED